jgi:glutamine synthetase
MVDLKNILERFYQLNITPIIGLEWEFYLLDQKNPLLEDKLQFFFQNILQSSIKNNVDILEIEKEQGQGQIEIKTKPYFDIVKLCQDFLIIKEIIRKISYQMNLESDFSAQKYLNDCGSSLQINLNFINKNNQNLFTGSSDNESKFLLFIISGILNNIPNYINDYIFSKDDLVRFDQDLNINLHKKGKYTAPVNISWGYDNRSCAIRIVNGKSPKNRRLEFRLPSSNAYLNKIIISLLKSSLDGIKSQSLPIKETYGNAFMDFNFVPIGTLIDRKLP